MLESGKIIYVTEKELIDLQMEINMLENLKMVNGTEKELLQLKHGKHNTLPIVYGKMDIG